MGGVAITAGGSTCWELAYLGVPSLVITLADNQRGGGEMMAAAGAGLDCGWHHELQPNTLARLVKELFADQRQRLAMSRVGRALVDGQGGSESGGLHDVFPLHLPSGRAGRLPAGI